jgi:hypothetical protein
VLCLVPDPVGVPLENILLAALPLVLLLVESPHLHEIVRAARHEAPKGRLKGRGVGGRVGRREDRGRGKDGRSPRQRVDANLMRVELVSHFPLAVLWKKR